MFKHCLSFFLWTSTIMPFFQPDGNIPFAGELLNMSSKVLLNEFLHILNIWMRILSWSCALFGLRFWIIFNISVFTNFTNDTHLSVRRVRRRRSLLSFFIKENCFAKMELKCLAFLLKLVTNVLLWNDGGITSILRLFSKIFNRLIFNRKNCLTKNCLENFFLE